jgi:long-chain acyl-CoA synthetase
MPRQSLVEYLEYFSRFEQDVACAHQRGYRQTKWTYREIRAAAAQFARELEARGVARGDRVMLWGENCGEWVAAFWGTLERGAVVVPMDRIATAEFAARVVRQVDAKLLVHSADLPEPVPGVAALRFEKLFETLSSRDPACDAAPYAGPQLSRGDIAEIIFTSGTTAEPKGVVLTHGNLLANLEPLESEIDKYRRYERYFHPLRFLNLLPLSHVFGQFMALFVPPMLGATVIFTDTLNPSEVIRTAKQNRVSALVAVPRMLASLKEKVERDLEADGKIAAFQRRYTAAAGKRFWRRMWRFRQMHRLFGWKFWAFISGGARLEDDTEEFWNRLGFAVVQGYGLTETASLISLNHPFRMGRGSIGQSLAGRDVKLGDDGEILVRGESIAAGYWRGRELEPVAASDGWFRTGDLGAQDEQGNLYFKGRKKNLIVTAAGMNVFPEDLEAALRRQTGVRDCVVIGVVRHGSRGGDEEPYALLILKTGAAAEEVVRTANESLAEYQQIRGWQLWPGEDFPRTSTGKPRLQTIRDVVRAETASSAGEAMRSASVAEAASPLAALIERITGRKPGNLSADSDLEKDLNLNSLDRVELLSALEDRFQTDLSEAQFSAARTVGELEKLLREPAAASSPYPYPRWPQWPPVALLRSIVYYALVWPATMIMAKPRIVGRQHLGREHLGREHLRGMKAPLLFVCNHVTRDDVGFVLAALPHRYRYRLATAMVGEHLRDLRHPPRGIAGPRRVIDFVSYVLVSALFNVFAMPKASGVRRSFQFAGESVDRGQSILVFPEGELTRDGKLGQFRSGIGVLAKTLNIPVVPMRVDGLYEMREAGRKFARPGFVRVYVGAPQRFDAAAEPEAIAQALRDSIDKLGV